MNKAHIATVPEAITQHFLNKDAPLSAEQIRSMISYHGRVPSPKKGEGALNQAIFIPQLPNGIDGESLMAWRAIEKKIVSILEETFESVDVVTECLRPDQMIGSRTLHLQPKQLRPGLWEEGRMMRTEYNGIPSDLPLPRHPNILTEKHFRIVNRDIDGEPFKSKPWDKSVNVRITRYLQNFRTLAAWLYRLPTKEKAKYMLDVIMGVKRIHEDGRSHGDVKPSNIAIVEGSGMLFDHELVDHTINTYFGTQNYVPFHYLSFSDESYDAYSLKTSVQSNQLVDMFACYLSLIECLAGRHPFVDGVTFTLKDEVLGDFNFESKIAAPIRLALQAQQIPKHLVDLLIKGIRVNHGICVPFEELVDAFGAHYGFKREVVDGNEILVEV